MLDRPLTRPYRILYLLSGVEGGATNSMIELMSGFPPKEVQRFLVVPPSGRTDAVTQLKEYAESCRELHMQWWNCKTRAPLQKRPIFWASSTLRSRWHTRPVLTLYRWIREWKIDLVHTSTSQIIDGAIAAKMARVPHVWHIRELISSNGTFQFWLPESILTRAFTGLSDAVIANSHVTSELFLRHGCENVHISHDGIEQSIFRPGSGLRLRKELQLGADDPLVAMVATPTAMMKRHDLFIEMASLIKERFPRARFAIFGSLPTRTRWLYNDHWKYFERLKDMVASLGLGSCLSWAGHQPDVAAMMDAIDVLVHPCGCESFGRIAVEAMAAGRPVVGVNSGGLSEIVVTGVTGFLTEPNAASLAQGVSLLLDDVSLRKKMGWEGQQRAHNHFSIERHVQRVREVYQLVLGRSIGASSGQH